LVNLPLETCPRENGEEGFS